MPCRYLHDENIEAYLCFVSAASKNEVFLFSHIFTFPLEKRKFEKSISALYCRGILPSMPMTPVDKSANAR
jgi:hypothetical protein